jgi:hypothetical protein
MLDDLNDLKQVIVDRRFCRRPQISGAREMRDPSLACAHIRNQGRATGYD